MQDASAFWEVVGNIVLVIPCFLDGFGSVDLALAFEGNLPTLNSIASHNVHTNILDAHNPSLH